MKKNNPIKVMDVHFGKQASAFTPSVVRVRGAGKKKVKREEYREFVIVSNN